MPDPIKKYKSPNGKIVAETDLKDKYGERFTSLVDEGTFSEVTEPIYKTPNGSYEVESVLKAKYGDKFNKLVSTNMFALDQPVKKKKSSVSTFQDKELDSEAKDSDGLLGTQERGQLVKDVDSGKLSDTIDTLTKENQAIKEEKHREITSLLDNYNQFVQPTEDDLLDVESALTDENEGENFLSKIFKYGMGAWRGVKPATAREEAKAKLKYQLAKQNEIDIKDVDDALVEDTYILNKRSELLQQKRNAKSEEFIEDNPEIKDKLKNYFSIKTGELSYINAKSLINIESLNSDLESLDAQLQEIGSKHDDTLEYSPEYYENNRLIEREYNKKVQSYNSELNSFNNRDEDLMSSEDELDLFKRNYNNLDNFVGKLGIASEELVLNLGYLFNKFGFANPNTFLGAQSIELDILAQKNNLKKERSGLRKGKSIDNINTWEDATEWALDLVAEQTPNTILMATTGGASLPVMGATAAGGKLYDLEDEERKGTRDYSVLEKYGAAFLTGTAEALSEKVSLGQISKAKRVFKSVGKDQLKEATSKYIKRELPEYFKDVIQEGGSEALAQFSENVVDKYLLGKDKNLTEGISDAFVSGAFMSGLVYKAPNIAKGLSQPFTNKDFNQNVGDNFKTIFALDEQLKEDLGPEVRTTIESKRDVLLETTNNLVDAEFKSIDNLDIEAKNELLSIEQSKYDLRQQAKAIQDEPNLKDSAKEALLKDISNDMTLLNERKETALKPKPVEEIIQKEDAKEATKPEMEVTAPEGKKKPKGKLEGKTYTTNTGELFKIDIYDAQYGKVENIKDRKREDRLSLTVKNDKGESIANLGLWKKEDNTWFANIADVNEENRRKGIATAMYDYAESNGFKIVDSEIQTEDGKAFKENRRKQNETQTKGDTVIDEDVRPRVESSVQQREGDSSQSTIEPTASKGKTYQVSDSKTAPKYEVSFNKGVLDIKDDKGNEPSAPTRRKLLDKYADDIDFSAGEKSIVPDGENVSPNEIIAKNSNNPLEVAELINATNTASYIENNIDYKKRILADNVINIEKQSYIDNGDANNIGNSMARSYFSKKGQGRPLDTMAQELSEDYGIEITEQDIVDHMETYPNGKNDVYKEFKDVNILPLQQRFTELTGLPANDKYISKAVNQAIAKEKLNEKIDNDYLQVLTEEELLSLDEESNQYEESIKTNTRNESRTKAKDSKKNEGKSRVREDGDGTSTEQASQARVKSLTNERIKPAKSKPNNKPKKLSTIVADVSKALKATLVYGKSSRRGTAGTYNPSNTLVKIRNANDLDTVAHELGHLLDDRHDLLGPIADNTKIKKELKWFSDRGGSNPPSSLSKAKKESYLQREGLAEFITAYVVNPTGAKSMAPELYKHFESTIDTKTKGVLKEFSKDVLDFENASYGDKIDANIEDSSLKEKKGFKAWLDQFKSEDGKLNIHFLDQVKSKWTNSMHIANKAYKFGLEIQGKDIKELNPEDNFEVISRLLAGINGKVNALFNNGLRDAKNKIVRDSKGLKFTVNYLLEGLDNTSESTVREEMRDVIKLLVAERTVEYAKKFDRTNDLTGISGGLGNDLEIAAGYLSEVEALKTSNKEKYNRIKEGARRYREFADAGLQYAVEKGRISQEQYDRIKETNEYYVSLARTKEVTPGDELLPFLNESNKISSVKDVIKRSKGGTDTIKDPYLSLLHNTVNFIKEADRNEVMNSYVDPFRKVRQMGDGEAIDLSQVARKVPSGEKNTVKVFNDGELEHWQFDQDVYESLKGLEGVSQNPIIKAISAPASLIRFTVTNFPVFAARNAVRDTMSRLVISRTKGKFKDLLHNKEDREMFETYGGSQAGFYLQNKDAYVDEMNKAVKSITKKGGVILDPRKLSYTGYRKALEKGENLNRIAEYKSAYQKAKKEGMDDYNAGIYAAYQARDLMDFAVAGHYMRVINKLIPFSNASIQSVKRNIKGAKENPKQFAVRMALYTLTPQLIARALVSAGGDEDEYAELPDYQKDLFWNFKTPMTGDAWISIPKPFELGLPSSFIDRGIGYGTGNKDALNGFGYSSYNTLNPFDVFSLTGPFKPMIESVSNYDSFRDRDIVPFWEKDKLIKLREGTKYASRIGKGLSDAFGFVGAEVDPRKIDHIIKGYTTYFGNTTLSLGDIGKEDSRNQFDFTKTGFAKGVPISSAKSVKKALDLSKDIGSDSDKKVKFLKGMVKSYYDLDDKQAKKELSAYIYDYSKDVLIPYLEAKKTIKLLEID